MTFKDLTEIFTVVIALLSAALTGLAMARQNHKDEIDKLDKVIVVLESELRTVRELLRLSQEEKVGFFQYMINEREILGNEDGEHKKRKPRAG